MRPKSCFVLLALGTLAVGCREAPGPTERAALKTETAAPKPYTIELVYQGLATFSPKPDGTWVFLGNTSDVAQLPYSRYPKMSTNPTIAKHEPRLLFPATAPAGVTISSPLTSSTATMCPPERDKSLGTQWSAVPIAGKHITMSGNLQPKAATYSGGAKDSKPCQPGAGCAATTTVAEQEADYRWVRNVSETLALGGKNGAFRSDLYAEDYAPTGYPLLAARFFLDAGVVSSSKLAKDNTDYTLYRVPAVPDWGPRAVARQVVVEFTAAGPVSLVSRDLSDHTAAASDLLRLDSDGSPVRIIVGNDVTTHADCHGNDFDWVMSYNYLETDPAISIGPLEVKNAGPLPDGSCSPDGGG